jgi:hypothetical protein
VVLQGGGTESGSFGVTGELQIDSGSFSFASGAAVSGTGDVSFFGGATVFQAGSSFNLTGTTDGTFIDGGTATFETSVESFGAKLVVDGGTIDLSTGQEVSLALLDLYGGTLTASDPLTITGTLAWQGSGTMSGSGKTTIDAGAFVNFVTGTAVLSGRTLNNDGTAVVAGGTPSLTNAVWNNDAGSFFTMTQGSITGDAASTFNNLGVLKTAFSTSTQTPVRDVNIALNNSGTVQVVGGTTLQLDGPITQLSGTTLTGGTWDIFNGGSLVFPVGSIVTTNEATITLNGRTAAFAALGGLASNAGALSILAGASLKTAGGMSNSGGLTLGPDSTLTVNSDFSQGPGGALNEQISGRPSTGLFGQLIAPGDVALDGALDVRTSITPVLGDIYPIVTYAGETGDFASMSGVAPVYAEAINPTDLTLTVVSLLSVTPSRADLAADAASLTISGTGFDPDPANDSVTFENDVTGTVTSATTTSLTVSLSGLDNLTGGTALHASVTVNGVISGDPVQVATVAPVVTASTQSLPSDATSLTISGLGFDSNAANDRVTFDDGVTGTVTGATATSLIVSLSGVDSVADGTVLDASVTVNGVSIGDPVPVASIGTIAPSVTASTESLPADATSLTIDGLGFDPDPTKDSVKFDNDVTGTVTSSTTTSLTVDLSGLDGLTGGMALHASVTVNGASSGDAVQVATIAPVLTASTDALPADSTSLTISGLGFDSNPANDVVILDDGVIGLVTSATGTSLTVGLHGLDSLTAGTALDASVTVNRVSSGDAVQVASVAPVVESSRDALPVNDTTLTISGLGFDSNPGNDHVAFDNGVTGTASSATETDLTVNLSGLKGLTGGTVLDASVMVNGVSSESLVPVASVAPVVEKSTANLPANATTLTILGLGFDSNPTNDIVTFDNGVVGTVIGTAITPKGPGITVMVAGLNGLTGGTALDASVTVNGVSSGDPVQVATIAPVVSSSSAGLPANATIMVLFGVGFDPMRANDTVSFDNGVTGVVFNASAVSLTVRLSGLSSLTGGTVLHASVTVNDTSSNTVPVATVTPAVTSSTASLPANAAFLTINGVGFDSNAANDRVNFSGGVTGTVTSATATSLTVSLSGLSSLAAGAVLYASVTTNAVSSGSPVPVATVTAAVTSSTIQAGESAGGGLWNNKNGQALINSFGAGGSSTLNGASSSTALADWLANTFPNLYGANAGASNLNGMTNAQVAAFYVSLFDLQGPKLDAAVLAAALNVYATTLSLRRTAAAQFGFAVTAAGLGAEYANVGANGATFGVSNNTALTVDQVLQAANQQAIDGVLYGRDQTLRDEAMAVFDCINQAGGL